MSRGRTISHTSTDVDDNFDLADLENQLYAQIHYGYNDGDDSGAGPSKADVDQSAVKNGAQRFVSSRCVVNIGNGTAGAAAARSHQSKLKSQRYWVDADSVSEPRPQRPKAKRQQRDTLIVPYAESDSSSNIPPDKRPKPFTPYTPLLSETGIVASKASTSASAQSSKDVGSSSPTKRQRKGKSDGESRVVNPFNKLRERHRKRKETYETKKSRAEKSRKDAIAVGASAAKQVMLVQSEPAIDEDDDIIFIPSAPPPLVCIDSSGDEEVLVTTAPVEMHKFTPPGRKSKSGPGNASNQLPPQPSSSRCPSPTSSIVSDDFIGHNDRRRIELDAFGGVADEELLSITQFNVNAVDIGNGQTASANITPPITTEYQIIQEAINEPEAAATFAAPSKRPNPFHKKSYVVSENSFAAVDVYESESSDMPDTIYNKGNVQARGNLSSDSDVILNELAAPKSKRLHKRKSSGSNKGSDYRTDLSSTDEDISDGNSDSDDADNGVTASQEAQNSLPYLVRGEALGKLKKIDKRRITKRRRTQSSKGDKTSDEEFLTKLSSICNDGNKPESDASEGDLEDDLEDDLESSHESIDAREIVQSVLQRRKKKLKVNSANETDRIATNNEWVVKDQIGVTDDVIFLNVNQTARFSEEDVRPQPEAIDGSDKPAPSTSVSAVTKRRKSTTVPEEDASGSNSVSVGVYPSVVDEKFGWNKEMQLFYNSSWQGETFCTKEIQHRQPRQFMEWAVSNADKEHAPLWTRNRRGHTNVKCINCKERGHRANACPLPPVPLRCYMCGETGHMEPRCPNTKCLICGRNTRNFVRGCDGCIKFKNMRCHVCRKYGHLALACPDKWRRYHSTIEPNSALVRHTEPLPAKPKYCSICSGKGHHAEHCRDALRIAEGPIPSLFIKNYEESYRRVFDEPPNQNASEFNMHHEPNKWYTFNFEDTVNADGNTFYSRFAKAIHLRRVQKKSVAEYHQAASLKRQKRKMEWNAAVAESAAKVQRLEENDTNEVETAGMAVGIDAVIQNSAISNDSNEQCAANIGIEPETDTKAPLVEETNTTESEVANTDGAHTEVVQEPKADSAAEENIGTAENVEELPGGSEQASGIAPAPRVEPVSNELPSNDASPPDAQSVNAADGTLPLFSFISCPKLAVSDSGRDVTQNAKIINYNLNSISAAPNSPKKRGQREFEMRQANNQPESRVKSKSNADDKQMKLKELQMLEDEEIRLELLKEEIMLNVSPNRRAIFDRDAARESHEEAGHETDSNYSFSDFYDANRHNHSEHRGPTNARPEKRSQSDPMPDFIPIDTPGPSNISFQTRSPTPPETEEISCVATVFLTKELTKFLLTTQGNNFLRNVSQKHSVVVRMEWRSFGNVLVVRGLPSHQEKFRSDLVEFCHTFEAKLKTRTDIGIPKNRLTLIKLLVETISQLEKPLGNISELFRRTKRCENNQSKTSIKLAERLRKEMNMVLMGQAGLADGQQHLSSLMQNLRDLKNRTDDKIGFELRKEINEHINYIFSPMNHGNYLDLIGQYKALRQARKLPILNLDRQLLGLPIAVRIDKHVAGGQRLNDEPEGVALQSPLITPSCASSEHLDKSAALEDLAENMPQNEVEEEITNEEDVKNPTKPSFHWSKKSLALVEKLENIPTIRANESFMSRLARIAAKSERNQICYNDYKLLTKFPANDGGSKLSSATSKMADVLEKKRNMDPIMDAPYNEDDGDDLDNISVKDIKNPNKPSTYWSKKTLELIVKWKNDPKIQANESFVIKMKKIISKSEKNQISYNDYKLFTRVNSNNTNTNTNTNTNANKPQEPVEITSEVDQNVSTTISNDTGSNIAIQTQEPENISSVNDRKSAINTAEEKSIGNQKKIQEATKPPQKADAITNAADDGTADTDDIDEKNIANPFEPSAHWSKKCLQMVALWENVPEIKSNKVIQIRLQRISDKGASNNISYNDFKVLSRIFNSMTARIK